MLVKVCNINPKCHMIATAEFR